MSHYPLQGTPAADCRYAVIDVETANPARRSICQVGVVLMQGAREIAARSWFVDPEGPVTLTWIHGITAEMLAGAPRFPEVFPDIRQMIGDLPLVAHSSFDQQALDACAAHHQTSRLENTWRDSMDMVRHVLDKPCPDSAALPDICRAFCIRLKHHDALSDARAAAQITAMAIRATGRPIEELAKPKPD